MSSSNVQTTTEVQSRHALDLNKLHVYLCKNLSPIAPYPSQPSEAPLTARQFGFGQSNPTFLLNAGGHRYVLRKKPPGKVARGQHAVEREFRVLSALQPTDVPTPKAYVLCEDVSVLGTPFYIMEYAEGRIFVDPTLPGMTNDERKQAYSSIISAVAALHNTDFRKVGLSKFGKHKGYYTRQLNTFKRVSDFQAARGAPAIDGLDDMIATLRAARPREDDDEANSRIVAGDFKLDNVVFHPTEPRVIAMLDWEMATIGHPMADMANFCAYLYHGAGGMDDENRTSVQGISNAELRAMGVPTEAELLARYSAAVGRANPDPHLLFHMAFFCFRGAIILQGIAARSKHGIASSAKSAMYIKALPRLVATANFVANMLKHQPEGATQRTFLPFDNSEGFKNTSGPASKL